MCICINCKHIRRCKTYEFIEAKHYKQNTKKKSLTSFIPINTIIAVNINKQKRNITLDWDLRQCSSFIEQPGYWLVKY